MFKVVLCCTSLMLFALTAGALHGQPAESLTIELANLREDMRGVSQRVNELQLRIEQLEKENSDLRGKSAGVAQSYATIAQLNEAISDLNRSIKTATTASKNETLQHVSVQMEKLANQMNTALESVARTTTTRAPSSTTATRQTTFSDDFPKEGVNYVVQKGETLAVIARKTGAKTQDIINANKITDPSHIQVGQTLFIPGGK